jgi:hypothetical protein
MTPEAPKPKDEGRNAEDTSLHKGDWGSHSHADYIFEHQEPTEEQIKNAQEVINTLWDTPKPQT